MTEKIYKVLNVDGSSCHGGTAKWFLPNGKPGKWMPVIKNPKPCVRGYHVLKPEMLTKWLGPAIFEVEVKEPGSWQGDKGVFSRARLIRRLGNWNEQTARLFACDCAESVVHFAKDERSVNAIRVARRFAFGLEEANALKAAREAAVRAADWAARDAASWAARDAARAAREAASWAASWAAAWAARAAAWAARDAAAWAARAADWAARDAAAWAARAADWAARDAARAACGAQTTRLFQYLCGKVDLEAIKASVA